MPRLGIDRQPQLGGQADGAQHAHRILTVARLRLADHAQRLLPQVGDAVVVVDDGFRRRVVIQRIDREIPARGVFCLAAEDVVAQNPPLLVDQRLATAVLAVVAAEGGDLDGFGAHVDVHDLEAAADDARATETVAHLFRRRVGRDVEVLRLQSGEQVAHRAADDERLITAFLQGLDGAPAAAADVVTLQAMLGDGDDCWFAGPAGSLASEDAGYELADHQRGLVSFSCCCAFIIAQIVTADGDNGRSG